MEESYTHYIYILRSEQWPSKTWHKVGYTDNPYRRIRDSCYTTTYVMPCEYNTLYEFETHELKSEETEKKLHAFLQDREGITYLYKKGTNSCEEMYDASLACLRKNITEYFAAGGIRATQITDKKRITKISTTPYIPPNEIAIFLQGLDTDRITARCLTEDEKCVVCTRRLTRKAFVFEYEQVTYYVGPSCYAKYNIGGFKDVFNRELRTYENCATGTYKVSLTTRILIHLIDTYRDIGDTFLQEYADKLIEKSYNISLWENLRAFFNKNQYKGSCHCNFLYGLHTFFNMYEDEYGEEAGGGLDIVKLSKYDILCQQIKPVTYEDTPISFDSFIFGSGNYEKKEANLVDISLRRKKGYIQTYMTDLKIDNEFYNAIEKNCDDADDDVSHHTTATKKETIRKLEDYDCVKYSRGILQGLAGTGKSTFVTECFADFFVKRREDIRTAKYKCYILSPTGKACAVLKDKLKGALERKGIEDKDVEDKKLLDEILSSVKTIDSILANPYPVKNHRYNRVDLIIDEMSMLNINHLHGILEMDIWAKVLIMGDWNQLPPVKKRSIAGVLVHITEILKEKKTNIFSRLSKMIRCEKPHRKSFEKLCRDILVERKEPVKPIEKSSLQCIRVIKCDTIDDVCKILSTDAMIAAWMQNEHIQKEEKNIVEEDTGCRIIVSNREEKRAIYGMQGIYEGFDKQKYAVTPLLGFRIKHTIRKNYYSQDGNHTLLHYNGEDQRLDQLKELIEDKKTRDLCPGIFKEIERSEVITVHASQGSTYANTVVILRKNEKRYKHVYTAITRWKKGCIIILYGPEKEKPQENGPGKELMSDEARYESMKCQIRGAMLSLYAAGKLKFEPKDNPYYAVSGKYKNMFRARVGEELNDYNAIDNFIVLHETLQARKCSQLATT